jgi:acetamidase/formamidase
MVICGGLSMGDIHWSQGDGEITFCTRVHTFNAR